MKKLTILTGILLFGLTSMDVSAQSKRFYETTLNGEPTIYGVTQMRHQEFNNVWLHNPESLNQEEFIGLRKRESIVTPTQENLDAFEQITFKDLMNLINNYEITISSLYWKIEDLKNVSPTQREQQLMQQIVVLKDQLETVKNHYNVNKDTNKLLEAKLLKKEIENPTPVIIYR